MIRSTFDTRINTIFWIESHHRDQRGTRFVNVSNVGTGNAHNLEPRKQYTRRLEGLVVESFRWIQERPIRKKIADSFLVSVILNKSIELILVMEKTLRKKKTEQAAVN